MNVVKKLIKRKNSYLVSFLYNRNFCRHKRDRHLFFGDIFDKIPIFLSK